MDQLRKKGSRKWIDWWGKVKVYIRSYEEKCFLNCSKIVKNLLRAKQNNIS